MLALPSVLLALVATSWSAAVSQRPLGLVPNNNMITCPAATRRVLTPELNDFIQEVVANGSIPGLALGIVHSGGVQEFGAWGKQTEDDDPMTAEASPLETVHL